MKFEPKRIFYNDQKLIVFSIVAAIIFWLIVVTNIYPEYNRTISGISVDTSSQASASDGTVSSKATGYSVIRISQGRVSVKVDGPRYLIGRLTAKNFTVRPSQTSVPRAGTFSVKLIAEFTQPEPQIRILSVQPSSVKIFYDKLVSAVVPVAVKLRNSGAAGGYEIAGTFSDPEYITVTGPRTLVAKLKSATAVVETGNDITKDVTKEAELVLYNSNGEEADISDISLSASRVNVTVSVLKTKSVHLTVDFSHIPAGVSKSSIQTAVTPSTVKLLGDERVINALSSAIKLATIDFDSLKLTNELNYSINVPAGITVSGDLSAAKVSVNLLNTSNKKVTVNSLSASNVSKGYQVKILTQKISNVLLYGPAGSVGSVNTIKAAANFSGISLKTGTRKLSVPLTLKDKTGYWVPKTYSVLVSVTKKK